MTIKPPQRKPSKMLSSAKRIPIYKLDERARFPVRLSDEARGYDLFTIEEVIIAAGERKMIRSGLAADIPKSIEFTIEGKSSWNLKGCLVSRGIIDSDYNGELTILMWNTTTEPITFPMGQAIAQLLVTCNTINVVGNGFTDYAELILAQGPPRKKTKRGDGGFGSTSFKTPLKFSLVKLTEHNCANAVVDDGGKYSFFKSISTDNIIFSRDHNVFGFPEETVRLKTYKCDCEEKPMPLRIGAYSFFDDQFESRGELFMHETIVEQILSVAEFGQVWPLLDIEGIDGTRDGLYQGRALRMIIQRLTNHPQLKLESFVDGYNNNINVSNIILEIIPVKQ